jgi:thiol:disulfide interchange protein
MRRFSLQKLARYERLLWIGLVAAVLVARWPILEALLHRATHAEAAASTIAWRTDLKAALAEARRTGRPVIADFNASWCPPCIVMKKTVWTDPAVEQAVTQGFVPLIVDVDREPALSDQFHVDTIPAVLVINGDGRVIRRAGFLPASGMLRFMNGT